MANYYGQWRTNYFSVKDPEAFRKGIEDRYGDLIEIVRSQSKHPEQFCLLAGQGSDSGSIPNRIYPPEDESMEGVEVDLPADVSAYLSEGSVAVFMESGAEKLRYIIGLAIAIDHTGKKVWLDLDQIYDKAAKKFKVPATSITKAEY